MASACRLYSCIRCSSQCESAAVIISVTGGCVLNEMSRPRAEDDSDILHTAALIYEFVTSVGQG